MWSENNITIGVPSIRPGEPCDEVTLKEGLMKRIIESVLTAGLLVLGVGILQKAQAASTDTMTVSVTPGNVAYGVTISSPYPSGYSFGQVNLGAVTISTSAITVTNSGSISEYFGMAISNLGTNSWTPVASNPPGADHFRLAAWFSTAVPASTTTFVDANALAAAANTTSGNLFNQGNVKTAPGTTPGGNEFLWLNLSMPTSLTQSISGSQNMTLSIDGQAN